MDLKTYLDEKRRLVDRALEAALPEADDLSSRLVEAMRYSLFAGGKRLRPVLCLAGAEAVGGRAEEALPAAVALEMIHTYSLIHDDLPGMDDDDLRRGRPSNHKVFGEGLAILAGDGLLTLAFGVLADAGRTGSVDPMQALAVTEVIARGAGYRGMVAGQTVDIEFEGREARREVVEFIHAHKTAALITASVVSGGIIGRGAPDRIKALRAYGGKLGVAFQITDDILDIEGDTAEIGKPAGSDRAKGKATYPMAVGLAAAKEKAAALLDEAGETLAGFGPEADPLRAVADYLVDRKK